MRLASSSTPPPRSTQDVEKATLAGGASLKRQKTEQVFSGAVAVIAIVYRPPPVPLPEAAASLADQAWPEPGPLAGGAGFPSSASTSVSPSSRHRRSSATIPPFPRPPPPPPQSSPRQASAACSPAGGGPAPPLSSSSPKKGKGAAAPQQEPQRPVFLHVANVGDCRAVLCRGGKAVAITRDHTPTVPSEAARVEAAGGFVSRGRVNGILGVSRSFGDIHCKVCLWAVWEVASGTPSRPKHCCTVWSSIRLKCLFRIYQGRGWFFCCAFLSLFLLLRLTLWPVVTARPPPSVVSSRRSIFVAECGIQLHKSCPVPPPHNNH